jgi:electron transport complex protein RnfG
MSTESAPAARPSLLDRWRSQVAYQGVSLGLICALVALALLIGNTSTQPDIVRQHHEDELATLRQVLPASYYDNNPLDDQFTVQDETLGSVEVFPALRGGELTAIAFKVSTVGYGGPIVQLIALDSGGRILGTRVLIHKETPGLADKIEAGRSDWITRFDGLSLSNTPLPAWRVKKDGGQFDQFAGATITPRAVVKGVLQALQFQTRHTQQLESQHEVQP